VCACVMDGFDKKLTRYGLDHVGLDVV
jgi:hypothetical protein